MTSIPQFSHLLPPSWNKTITDWLNEDCPSFDWGGYVVGEDQKTATLYCKSEVSNEASNAGVRRCDVLISAQKSKASSFARKRESQEGKEEP